MTFGNYFGQLFIDSDCGFHIISWMISRIKFQENLLIDRGMFKNSKLLKVGGSASVHAGIHTPGCGPGDHHPLGVGLETPRCGSGPRWVWAWRPPSPQPDPSTSALGVGLETCKACWDTPPRPARHAGIPRPCEQND